MSRDNLHIARRDNGGRRNRRLVDRAESDFTQCNAADADRGASCCRYLALLVSIFKSPVFLLLLFSFSIISMFV